MVDFKVDYKVLRSSARTLKDIEKAIGDFSNAEPDLDCIGSPTVNKAYGDFIAHLRTVCRKYSKEAGDLGSMLDNVADEVRNADNNIGEQASQMVQPASHS